MVLQIEPVLDTFDPDFEIGIALFAPGRRFHHFADDAEDHAVAGLQVASIAFQVAKIALYPLHVFEDNIGWWRGVFGHRVMIPGKG